LTVVALGRYDAAMQFSLKSIFVAITLVCVVTAFPWCAYLFAALGLGLAIVLAAVVGTFGIPIIAYLVFKQRLRISAPSPALPTKGGGSRK